MHNFALFTLTILATLHSVLADTTALKDFTKSCDWVTTPNMTLSAWCTRLDGAREFSQVDLLKEITNENGKLLVNGKGQQGVNNFTSKWTLCESTGPEVWCWNHQTEGNTWHKSGRVSLDAFIGNNNGFLAVPKDLPPACSTSEDYATVECSPGLPTRGETWWGQQFSDWGDYD
ncbi:hypothetical protein NKR23_g11732 [Pleurostoma richardsiae]|uniref:Cyanovirin-N domain-containing protein n=1 Tax=Pleurostoma richardsiae TaxID=41990 RepID=A0AA38R783_9PEZI|nr:hypothetical protein NKR23_g11732 [Pleurostoma richardsiae]